MTIVEKIGKGLLPELSISKGLRDAMRDKHNCYEIAARLALDNDLTLVHGWPLGYGGVVKEKRYGHAWCEKVQDILIPNEVLGIFNQNNFDGDMPASLTINTTTVIDLSNVGNKSADLLSMPIHLYYYAGHINREHCVMYDNRKDIFDMLMVHETWGPWGEPPEEYLSDVESLDSIKADNIREMLEYTTMTPREI